MKSAIVITTIFQPSKAVKAYACRKDHDLIVVGDRKTPANWACKGAEYLSIDRQSSVGPLLNSCLPFDHYARKMFGYLFASQMGAGVIIDTDDDNFPKDDWGFPPFEGNFTTIKAKDGFVNIYQWFTNLPIWPRGLPLNLVTTDFELSSTVFNECQHVGVWQGLADDDPDVDAVYRLTVGRRCFFDKKPPVVLPRGVVCPFNSQNTAIARDLFPLLYLPAHVTFRFTDILRGLVAQPIMWATGRVLGFTNATVIQERNAHDYMKDFCSEIPMYVHCGEIVAHVSGAISATASIPDNMHKAYSALLKKAIVKDDEMRVLDAWLGDIGRN